ncbi:hypothetical protein [Halomicrobium sp. LC1Hm]|uniref:hypothetical protein n=1 Tax=Halomicrobium sp. LC1Hm TaxID=2610902 RepID=UPI001298260B|nr:hypothetical protein [Halomicrobium sp. LC1Hm]QGA81405.1 hypothetical protein LC1Hm_0339 [Halomicrobium sp. LC1Hm]
MDFEDMKQHSEFGEYSQEFTEAARNMVSRFTEEELDIDKQLSELDRLVQCSDPESILQRIALGIYLSGHISTLPVADDGIGIGPDLANFVIGKVIASDEYGQKEPSYKEIAQAAVKVEQAYVFENTKDLDPEDLSDDEISELQLQTILRMREVGSSRFMYHAQIWEGARRAYRPHNEQLKELNGFTIDEAIDFANFFMEVVGIVLNDVIATGSNMGIEDVFSETDSVQSQLQEFQETGKLSKRHQSPDLIEDSENIEELYGDWESKLSHLWVDEQLLINQLPENCSKSSFNSFLSRMSRNLYDYEREFVGIDDFNPVHKFPIVERESQYLIPHTLTLQRSILDTFFYDLISMDGYGDASGESGEKFGDKWGDYIENWSYDSLSMLFPDSDVYLNPKYKTDGGNWEEATDILVLHRDYLLLFECKSKKLELESRSGSISTAKDDLKKGIGKGTKQASRFLDIIDSRDEVRLRTEDDRDDDLLIRGEDIKSEFINIVLGEQYDTVGTTMYRDILDLYKTPYVVSVYDLQIMADLLEPMRFIGYVSQRINFGGGDKVRAMDEIDILGLFVNSGYELPDLDENEAIQILDYSRDVAERLNFKYGP